MTYKSYIGTVNFNAADEVFHGKINGINDLIWSFTEQGS